MFKWTVTLVVVAAAGFVFFKGAASAQVRAVVHQSTTQPTDGRFEVVQSPIAAKWTFRLDRFTGSVGQLVRTKNDELAWEKMSVLDLPAISNPDKARFVIFTSGIAARHTFLLDSQTGSTWMLTSSGDQFHYWRPFAP